MATSSFEGCSWRIMGLGFRVLDSRNSQWTKVSLGKVYTPEQEPPGSLSFGGLGVRGLRFRVYIWIMEKQMETTV